MASPKSPDGRRSLPWLAGWLLRVLSPKAERDELVEDVRREFDARAARNGIGLARRWLWGQILASGPPLIRRSWWRGWSGFEPKANQMRPGGMPMESWIMDVRYAARRLRSRPLYTLLAVVTLALGVGGTAAIYSIVRGLLFDPLPYADEDRVVTFWHPWDWSETEFLFLRPQMPAFANFAGYRHGDVTLDPSDDSPARLLTGMATTAELFDVLGASPAMGRTFRKGDDERGAEAVAVLSHKTWRELGSDPSLVGKRVRMSGVDRTVIGVMPPNFWFPDPTVQVWTAAQLDPENESGNYVFIGRLASGQRLEAIGAPLKQITTALGERFRYPAQWDKSKDAVLTPIRESLVGSLRPALIATAVALSLILLMSCANVAALMLGQVEGQAAELAVRSAMGADRRRLTQQLVAEAMLVGGLAGVTGGVIAAVGFKLMVATLPLGAWAANARIDWTLFAAAILIAVAAAVAIVIVPTISLWRGDLRGALTRARTSAPGRGGRLEGGLVVLEVSLAVLMAAGAALLIRSVSKLYSIDPGVNTKSLAVIDATMPSTMGDDQRRQAMRAIVSALAAIPGAEMASAAQLLPFRRNGDNWGIRIESNPELPSTTTVFRIVQPGYHETMGFRLVAGRTFTADDRPNAERVVVINEALAKQYFPGRDPIGQRIGVFREYDRIIGIVADAREGSLSKPAEPARYMLYDQIPYAPSTNSFVIRTKRAEDVPGMLEAARAEMRKLAPTMAVQEVTSMAQAFDRAVGPTRQIMGLLSLLTVLAMALGAIGVYGVISHFVNRRKRDWGIRIALGLKPRVLIGQVVGRGARLVAVGIVIGIGTAIVSSKLLVSLLYGVESGDPLALGAATLALLVVGVLAAYLPAYRASRVDPAIVLKDR